MADTSALFCLSSFQPLIISSSRFLSQTKLPLSSTTSSSSFSRQKLPRFVRSRVIRDPDDQRNHGEDDPLGFYPWDPRSFSADGGDGIQWLPEDRITLLTSDGLLQIGGSLVPRRISPTDKQRSSQRQERFQESNYMDPEQGLCLGALFNIAATNGLDSGRRLCFFGFCRSIEMLSDVVEDTVLEHGGEVVGAEKASKGLNEKLTMRVAVPLLWGVPPASETLHVAVRSGGGIIDKVYWQWDFLAPCCDKANVKRGPWSPEEDMKLKDFIEKNGTGGNWIAFPHKAGLMRCGKSCRLRWLNYLRPNIKHGQFTETEDMLICNLFATIGSRWSVIANHLPGRTDNDIKNYWNTKLKKKLLGIHPPAQTRIVRSSNHHQQQPFYFSPNMDIQNFHATTHEAQLMNTATAATSATAVPCLFQHYPVKEADDQKLELENNIKDGGGGLWSLLCNNNGVSAWGDEGGSAFNYGTSAINGCNELFLDDPNSASAAAAGDSYKSQEKDMYYNYC